ncbi:hypothetical protein DSO57_1035223 [Entomophthora muscae]|uniref:Uncharacterized protein n=1 Tax=Entomophthora muscae TaxID=34485 RepID=A0ACC2SCK9_9FUNG|nr:hypothetical protein DSO57_1035223 [Entomophthora muscae]
MTLPLTPQPNRPMETILIANSLARTRETEYIKREGKRIEVPPSIVQRQETRAQGWDLNPEPLFLQAAGPMDQGPACPCFFGIEPPQAEAPANFQSQNTCTSSTMVAPKEEPLKLPNGSRDGAYVKFMSMKSSQVTNQTLLPKINPGFGPNPVTTAKNQENQVTKLNILTNERTPS